MLTLILLRHAKSSWDDPSLDDFDRPLAPRGIKAATAMAHFLESEIAPPDTIVCSPAQRARETLALVLPALEGEMDISMDRALYDLATPGALFDHVRSIHPGARRLMLIGHNPLLEQIAAMLVGAGQAADRQAIATKYPTGALAEIDFKGSDWNKVEPGSGTLKQFIQPRNL